MYLNKLILPKKQNDLENGVFHYLQKNKKENEYFITNSSILDERVADGSLKYSGAEILTNYERVSTEAKDNWVSLNEPNSSFTISFNTLKLSLTHYTFLTRTYAKQDMPKGWIVEGSFNNKNWTEVDKQFVDKDVYLKNSFYYPLRKDEIENIKTVVHFMSQSSSDKVGNVEIFLYDKKIGTLPIYERKKKKENFSFLKWLKSLF